MLAEEAAAMADAIRLRLREEQGEVWGVDPVFYLLPGPQVPVVPETIELEALENDGEPCRFMSGYKPKCLYEDPRHIAMLCRTFTESGCEHACQWVYGLSVEECRRMRSKW